MQGCNICLDVFLCKIYSRLRQGDFRYTKIFFVSFSYVFFPAFFWPQKVLGRLTFDDLFENDFGKADGDDEDDEDDEAPLYSNSFAPPARRF